MKIEGWEGLLAVHIEQAGREGFAWGENDCALWCADWILKATSNDLAAEWRGQYSTEEELQTLMRTRGYETIEQIADAYGEAKSVKLAQRGDILLHPNGFLGICTGKDGVFVAARGVITERTLSCVKAWGV